MYRIKTLSGDESVFKTLEEFNTAVRSGVISPDSEIFHSRAERWLEVRSHPHYRAALSWKPEATNASANGSAPQAARPVSRTNGVKPGKPTEPGIAEPAAAASVARPAPPSRVNPNRPVGDPSPDAKQMLSELSGKQSTMPSEQQPSASNGHPATNGHPSSTHNGKQTSAAPASASTAAPPKPHPIAPGLRTVVAPPKPANKPAANGTAQPAPTAAPKPQRKPSSAEILFIDLEDESPVAGAAPALSSSSEQPAVKPVASERRVAASPVAEPKESSRAESPPRVERSRAAAADPAPRAEARPSTEHPKPKPAEFGRPATQVATSRASEPAAPKSAGPVAPVPETELDFLVMGPSAEPVARRSNGERTIEHESKARSESPALGHSGSSPLVPPLPPRTQLLHGSGSRPAMNSAKLAAVGIGNSWPIERKAESPSSSSPDAQLAAALASNRPSTRLASVPTLETAPITLPTMEPMIPERPKSKSSGAILTVIGIAAVLSSVLFVWKPWHNGVAKPSSTQSTQGATLANQQRSSAQSSTPSVSEPATTKPNTAASAPVATSVPAPAAATTIPTSSVTIHGEKVARPDSSSQPEEQIEAAVSPGFQSESIDISSAKVDLSTSTAAGSSAIAPTELSRRYAAATAQARQEFLAKVVSSGFIRIFSTQRLSTADGISGAQAAWTGGAEAVRQYRARIVKLESIYGDSVISSQRVRRWPPEEMRAWASHASLTEPGDVVQVADLMFRQVGDMLALLQSQQGQYDVKGGGFAFKDPAVAQRYNTSRIWVAQRAETWASTPESARPLTISQILKALGDGLPAVAS